MNILFKFAVQRKEFFMLQNKFNELKMRKTAHFFFSCAQKKEKT